MSVRYDPLLCQALATELGALLGRQPLGRLHLDRERRAAILAPRKGPALIMLLHPEAGFLLRREAVAPLSATINLKGSRVGHCASPPDERSISIDLVGGTGVRRLVLELQTNQWNVVLVGAARTIEAVLWTRRSGPRTLRQGAVYSGLASERRFADVCPTREQWSELVAPLEDAPVTERRAFLLREVAYVSAINIGHLAGPENGEATSSPARSGRGWADGAFQRYVAVRDAAAETHCRAHVLRREWGAQPYVSGLEETDSAPVGSLLDGFEIAFEEWRGSSDDGGRQAEVAQLAEVPDVDIAALLCALEERRDTLEGRLGSLHRELEKGPPSEELRKVGNLLLARIAEVPRAVRSVTLTDFDGTERQIELDPRREPAENAASYYERARRRERAEQSLPGRLAELEGEIERLARAIETLPESGPSDEAWALAGGRPPESAAPPKRMEAPRLPYRQLFTSGGLEIRIGRGSRDNDELTFRHSAPDDIWLHARQSPGAHVVLRWGRRDENPPQRDLVEAAIAAAVNSEARHSKTVAIDWTRRKYVRKPRKAPPGTVTPDRVKTLFVEPDESVLRRLRDASGGS